MAKYKVLKPIRDLKQDKMLEVGDVVELTVKRVEESEKAFGTGYLERIEEQDKGGE